MKKKFLKKIFFKRINNFNDQCFTIGDWSASMWKSSLAFLSVSLICLSPAQLSASETAFGTEGVSIVASAALKDIEVRGTVVDAKGESLPGVSVTLKGSTSGTMTDAAGKYRITSPDDGTLVFTYIGFETQEISIKGRTTINITLQESSKELDQVVVVGYGRQR